MAGIMPPSARCSWGNQLIELPLGEFGTAITRSKLKPPLVQSPVAKPEVVASMHKHHQPGAAAGLAKR